MDEARTPRALTLEPHLFRVPSSKDSASLGSDTSCADRFRTKRTAGVQHRSLELESLPDRFARGAHSDLGDPPRLRRHQGRMQTEALREVRPISAIGPSEVDPRPLEVPREERPGTSGRHTRSSPAPRAGPRRRQSRGQLEGAPEALRRSTDLGQPRVHSKVRRRPSEIGGAPPDLGAPRRELARSESATSPAPPAPPWATPRWAPRRWRRSRGSPLGRSQRA